MVTNNGYPAYVLGTTKPTENARKRVRNSERQDAADQHARGSSRRLNGRLELDGERKV